MAKDRVTIVIQSDVLELLQKRAEAASEALSPHLMRLIEAGLETSEALKVRDIQDSQRADEITQVRKALNQASSRCSTLENEIGRQQSANQQLLAQLGTAETLRSRNEAQLVKARHEMAALRDAHEDERRHAATEKFVAVVHARMKTAFSVGIIAATGTLLLTAFVVWILPSQSRGARAVALLAMGEWNDPFAAAARLAGYENGRFIVPDDAPESLSSKKSEKATETAADEKPKAARYGDPKKSRKGKR